MKHKRILIPIIMILILVLGIFLMFNKNKEITLDNVLIKNNIDSNIKLAMYKENDNNTYEEIEENTFPTTGYILNLSKSKCVDNVGNEISNVLSYDVGNKKVVIDTNKTVYCYLYFDLYKVNLNANGGTISNNYAIIDGSLIEKPVKRGHDFLNWNTNSNCNGSIVEYASENNLTQDQTLYACYSKKSLVLFNNGNGSENLTFQIEFIPNEYSEKRCIGSMTSTINSYCDYDVYKSGVSVKYKDVVNLYDYNRIKIEFTKVGNQAIYIYVNEEITGQSSYSERLYNFSSPFVGTFDINEEGYIKIVFIDFWYDALYNTNISDYKISYIELYWE